MMNQKRHVPRGLFTCSVSVSVSLKVIVKVKHVSMVNDALTGKMDVQLILSVKRRCHH